MVVAATACNNKEVDPTVGTLSGHYIGFGEVSIDPVMTKSGDQILVSDSEKYTISDNFFISGNVTVEPIGSSLSTKAVGDPIAVPGEITRDNLRSFYVDGFLDATNPHVTEDAHFIGEAPTTYEADATSDNRSIKGRWFFTPKTAYQWRNRVCHYFWAYSGYTKNKNFSVTKDGLEFDFDTESMSKDLVVAYHEQYWDDSHITDQSEATTYHNGEDELRILPFKHAVAAVGLENNIQFAKFNNGNPDAPINGKYNDKDLDFTNYKDEDETTPRLEIEEMGMYGYTTGHIKVEGGSISWDESKLGGHKSVRTLNPERGGKSTYFMIPQLVNTTEAINQKAIAVFKVKDNKLTKSQDFVIPLPRFTTGSAAEYWQAGLYYAYNFKGRFIAPFVPEGSEDGYPANFGGQPCQVNIPFDPIDVTYLKTLRLKWDILPSCQSNGGHIYIYLSKKALVEGTDYIVSHFSKGTHSFDINILQPETANGYDIFFTDDDLICLELKTDQDKATFVDLSKGGTVASPTIKVKFGESETYSNVSYGTAYQDLTGSVLIDNIDVSNKTGQYYVYIGYDGGNASDAAYWIMMNISLDIVD